MIVIVNYNMGNIGSLLNMVKKIGAQAVISSDPDVIIQAEKLILPGVGSFDNGMRNIEALGLRDVLNVKVLEKRAPVLGICLGMQLLGKRSEEGELAGLGWINAESVRFNISAIAKQLKVPHMGWNYLQPRKESMLLTNMDPKAMFYFVHSYYVRCEEASDILATSDYGIEFAAAVEAENIMGVQFHPEKSLRYGKNLLRNFCLGGLS